MRTLHSRPHVTTKAIDVTFLTTTTHLHALDEAVPVALAQQAADELARLEVLELVHVLACTRRQQLVRTVVSSGEQNTRQAAKAMHSMTAMAWGQCEELFVSGSVYARKDAVAAELTALGGTGIHNDP